jgi:hypothetical protein
VRRNLQSLLKVGSLDVDQIRKEFPPQRTLAPAQAMKELFTLSAGQVGTGLYVRHAGEEGGVSIIDLPSVFLEMLEPESALRYLWVSHRRSVGAEHPVDPLIRRTRSCRTDAQPESGSSRAASLAVSAAVRSGLESRLLGHGAPRMELYLAVMALGTSWLKRLARSRESASRGSSHRWIRQQALSQRARCWRPSTSPAESPVWNARIAAMLLLDQCGAPRARAILSR